MKRLSIFIVVLSVGIIACNETSQSQKKEKKVQATTSSNAVKYQLVTSAIPSPVQLVTPPDHTNRLFVMDLSGKVFILQHGQVQPAPFIDISSKLEQKDTTPSMRAVFSMAFHPDFERNKKFYVCYNAPAGNSNDKCKLRVSEFKVRNDNPDRADPTSERKVFEVQGSTVGVDDCQIAFGPDGYLYIAIGDNGTPLEKREGQQLNSYLGKLLRIDVNKTPYAIPADNPFVNNKDARPEIWSYGLRRLWRFTFDPQSQQLFGADVGDKAEEEIDLIQKGGNYGWPVKEGDSLAVKNPATDTSTFIAPLNTYSHKEGICIIGGAFYYGNDLPFLKNSYVFADFNGKLFSLYKDPHEKWIRQPVQLLNPPADPLVIFSVDKDQNNGLYVLGVLNTREGSKGVIYKLVHS